MRLLFHDRELMNTQHSNRLAYNKKTSDSVSTLLNTLMLIPRHRTISTQEIHQQLLDIGIDRNPRSIKRYLDDIIIDLFNVEKDESNIPHTYRKTGDNLLKLGPSEALVLCLIDKYLKPIIPDHIFKAYQSQLEDATQLLNNPHANSKEATWLDKVYIADFANPNLLQTIKPKVTQAISDALFNNRLLNLQYNQALINTEMSEPLGIVLNKDNSYLVCRHQHSMSIKTLPIQLIESVSVSTFNFEYPADFSLQDYVNRAPIFLSK